MTPNSYYTTPTALSMNHGPYQFLATSSTDHFCGIDLMDDAYCWGDNGDGELGDGMGAPNVYVDLPVLVAGGYKWKTIDLGSEVTCGITVDDEGFCWGEGIQHGLGTSASVLTPTELRTGETWRNIDLYGSAGCGATTGGQVYCWGSNDRLKLGYSGNSSSPRLVDGVSDAIWVSIGATNACAATESGETYCWGARSHGRLGDGINAIVYVPTPLDVTDVEFSSMD
jgi:alpha-tubulin suppressor-like RCC1 family protein